MVRKDRVCDVCESIFTPSSNCQKRCSPACASKGDKRYNKMYNAQYKLNGKKPLSNKTCPICNIVFKQTNTKQIYCGHLCRAKAIASNRKELKITNQKEIQMTMQTESTITKTLTDKTCVTCGTIFTPRTPANITCNEECKKLHKREENRKRYYLSKNLPLQLKASEMIKTCPICLSTFTPKVQRQIFCSKECSRTNDLTKPKQINTINYDNPYKNRARSLVIDNLPGPVRMGIMFPSKECLDVKELIEKGFIDKDSKILAIEKYSENRISIEKFLNAMQIEHSFYCSAYVKMPYLLSHMNKEKSNLCWFDACQTMTKTHYDWFHYNILECGKAIFELGTVFAFSFISHARMGEYIKVDPTQSFHVHNSGIENVAGSFSQEKFDEIMYTTSTLIPFPIKYCDRFAYSSPKDDGTKSNYTIYTYTFIT